MHGYPPFGGYSHLSFCKRSAPLHFRCDRAVFTAYAPWHSGWRLVKWERAPSKRL